MARECSQLHTPPIVWNLACSFNRKPENRYSKDRDQVFESYRFKYLNPTEVTSPWWWNLIFTFAFVCQKKKKAKFF